MTKNDRIALKSTISEAILILLSIIIAVEKLELVNDSFGRSELKKRIEKQLIDLSLSKIKVFILLLHHFSLTMFIENLIWVHLIGGFTLIWNMCLSLFKIGRKIIFYCQNEQRQGFWRAQSAPAGRSYTNSRQKFLIKSPHCAPSLVHCVVIEA